MRLVAISMVIPIIRVVLQIRFASLIGFYNFLSELPSILEDLCVKTYAAEIAAPRFFEAIT